MKLTEKSVIEKFEGHDYWVLSNTEGYPHPLARKLDIMKMDLSPFSSLGIFKNRMYRAHVIDHSIFSSLNMSNSTFHEEINYCRFDGTELVGCTFSNIEVKHSTFKNADLSNSEFNMTTFINCDFDSASLDHCIFNSCLFNNCRFDNASIQNSDFNTLNFDKCEILFANFAGCNFNRMRVTNNSVWVGCNLYSNSDQPRATFTFLQIADSIFYNSCNLLMEVEEGRVEFKNARIRKSYISYIGQEIRN